MKNLSSIKSLMLLFLLSTMSLLLGCKSNTLVVGAVLPLSGPDQALGEAARQGLELAAAQWVEKGNERLDLRIVDSESDPEKAASLLTALYNEDNAVAAIGVGSTLAARAMAPVAHQAERILILPSEGEQRLAADSEHVYRMTVSDELVGGKLAAFTYRKLNGKKATILAQDEHFKASLEAGFGVSFENFGGEYLEAVISEAPDADTVKALRKSGCDTVAINGSGAWMEQAVKALRSGNYRGRILAPQSFSRPATLEALGKDARKVLFAYSPFDIASEPGSQFVEAFEALHGTSPSLFAAEAYDSLNIFMTASTDRPAIASEIRRGLRDEIKNYPAVTGSIELDASGSPTKFPSVYSLSSKLAMRDHEALIEKQNADRQAKIKEIERKLREMGSR